MDSILQDLRYATRMLLKKPFFTAVIVITLSLGIGANTALFSTVDAVLLKKLPVPEPDRLLLFKSLVPRSFTYGGYNGSTYLDPVTGLTNATSFPYQTFLRFNEKESSLSDIVAFASVGGLNVKIEGQAEVASGQAVSGNYYSGLGVQPLIGRTITTDDDRKEASPTAVISYRYWQRRFGGTYETVGSQVSLNNVIFTIIGVTRPEFSGTLQVGSSPDITVPLMMEPQLSAGRSRMDGAGQWWLKLIGRMKPGVSPEQAVASLEATYHQSVIEHRMARQNQQQSQGAASLPTLEPTDYPRLAVQSGSQGEMDTRRYYAPQLYLLLGVVGLVLLIACANVANLLLARAASRTKEIAVRLAMGASRKRLIRQLLTESILLATLGGLVGILFALLIQNVLLATGYWGGQGMAALDTSLDLRVFGFTVALSLGTGILFGIAPAFRATRLDLTPALKDTGKNSSGVSRSLLSKSLIVAQVAMSMVLLIGAALIIRTLYNLQNLDAGFNRNNLLLFDVAPNLLGYRGDRLANVYSQIAERVESLPGVRSATFSRNALLSGGSSGRGIFLPGPLASTEVGPDGQRRSNGETWIHQARENYVEAMEIPLLAGRHLSLRDDSKSQRVAVINQTLANHYWPGEEPIGKRFGFNPQEPSNIEVVGLVRDSKYANLREEIRPTAYLPWLQELPGIGAVTFTVRTSGDPTLLSNSIRDALREVDANLPLSGVRTQVEQVSQSLRMERLFVRLLSFFGILALSLAAIGLYGVMAYSVAQRTQEIGIRIALGAQPRDVLKMVILQGMILAIIGVAVGVGGAIGLTRLMATLLYGVSPTDPIAMAGVAVVLSAVALLACWLPARRAARVDAMVALRYE
jgi:predicted permease